VFALLIVVFPGGVFGWIAISNGRRALTETIGRQLAEEARSGADSLAATLGTELGDLRTFAHQDLMREIRIGDLDKRISAFLVAVKSGDQSIVELRVTDPAGRIVAASDPSAIGRTDPPVAGASTAPPAESLRGPFRRAGGSALELSVPVPDPDRNGDFLGRLTALYDWAHQTGALGQIRQDLREMSLEADIVITDGSGVVIGGAVEPGTRAPIGRDLRAAGWTALDDARGRASSGFAVEPAARALVGYSRVPGAAPAWTILVMQPLSKALQPVRAMTVRLGIGLAAALALALGLAIVLANRVARPLRELTRATREISSGEPAAVPITTRSRDEVGQLTAAFNQMSVDLRRAQSEVLEAAKFAFVGELAAGIAHQVRTTLGVLRSSAEILQPSLGARDAEAAELIQIMLDEIEHLDGVVTQLLDLGRPRQLTIDRISLRDVLFRAADFAEPQARAKSVTIRRVGGEAALALCDEGQMYEVALNLIVNAVQVVPIGGEVALIMLPKSGGGFAGFEVRDNGPGIPEDIRQKIFMPFFTRREGGIGLGLTVVRRVIQEHKGKLSVESIVGTGSVFRVELPVAESTP
jgi:two-component system, NtrC family, sensor histidine kinase HydH